MKAIKNIFVLILSAIIILSALPCVSAVGETILGDPDRDGDVNVMDATAIQRHVAQISFLSDASIILADVDSDSVITIIDATIIQQWLAGYSVSYPIGEQINDPAPTEEKKTAPSITPTEVSTTSTEAPTQTQSIIRNDKTVTVDGIDFNISKIPDAITLDNSSGNTASFILRNKALPDPADVHIEVVSDNHVIRINYNDERYKETYLASLNGQAIGCDYLIRDENDKDVAWVNAHFTNTAYPYQVSITGLIGGSCSFSVDFYYRDILLTRTDVTVNLSEGYGYADETKAIVRKIERACWDSDMTDKEKMKAVVNYIRNHFTYKQLKCTGGALYTALAARDLGLDSMLLYPGGEENQPCPRHLITYNLYFNTTVPGGHCACLVVYDSDCVMRYDVQGGACVIRDYL